jgi:hypothetical protein
MHTIYKPSDLWAACALPGDGSEYRFTAAPPRNPLRSLRTRARAYRSNRKEAR